MRHYLSFHSFWWVVFCCFMGCLRPLDWENMEPEETMAQQGNAFSEIDARAVAVIDGHRIFFIDTALEYAWVRSASSEKYIFPLRIRLKASHLSLDELSKKTAEWYAHHLHICFPNEDPQGVGWIDIYDYTSFLPKNDTISIRPWQSSLDFFLAPLEQSRELGTAASTISEMPDMVQQEERLRNLYCHIQTLWAQKRNQEVKKIQRNIFTLNALQEQVMQAMQKSQTWTYSLQSSPNLRVYKKQLVLLHKDLQALEDNMLDKQTKWDKRLHSWQNFMPVRFVYIATKPAIELGAKETTVKVVAYDKKEVSLLGNQKDGGWDYTSLTIAGPEHRSIGNYYFLRGNNRLKMCHNKNILKLHFVAGGDLPEIYFDQVGSNNRYVPQQQLKAKLADLQNRMVQMAHGNFYTDFLSSIASHRYRHHSNDIKQDRSGRSVEASGEPILRSTWTNGPIFEFLEKQKKATPLTSYEEIKDLVAQYLEVTKTKQDRHTAYFLRHQGKNLIKKVEDFKKNEKTAYRTASKVFILEDVNITLVGNKILENLVKYKAHLKGLREMRRQIKQSCNFTWIELACAGINVQLVHSNVEKEIDMATDSSDEEGLSSRATLRFQRGLLKGGGKAVHSFAKKTFTQFSSLFTHPTKHLEVLDVFCKEIPGFFTSIEAYLQQIEGDEEAKGEEIAQYIFGRLLEKVVPISRKITSLKRTGPQKNINKYLRILAQGTKNMRKFRTQVLPHKTTYRPIKHCTHAIY